MDTRDGETLSILINSTQSIRNVIETLMVEKNNTPKADNSSIDKQISVLEQRYQRDMLELFRMCDHVWESHYNYENNGYEVCSRCSYVLYL